MISIITYCRHPMPNSVQERNVAKTVGTEYEYRIIDGSKGTQQHFAGAYNWALAQAKGDIIVFIADDAYFMNVNWGPALAAKFEKDPNIGIIGVAGTQYLFADKYSLTAAGRPFVKGRAVYHLQNGDFFAVVFSAGKGDHEVVVCDGYFFAVRADVFKKVRFDEQTFTGVYFYDLDFCLESRKVGSKIIVTSDITVKKMSQPVFDDEWNEAGRAFQQKHQKDLPASCAAAIPDPAQHAASQIVNLRGKYSPDTIC